LNPPITSDAIPCIEPERLFSFTWHPYGIDPKVDYSKEPPTLVEFTLSATPTGGTLLVVSESGFDKVPAGTKYYYWVIANPATYTAAVSGIRTATLGGPAVFYGDSAIAYGTATDTFELSEGLKFTLNSNWSTTAVKDNGQWKVAALHFSTNLFDNPLLNNAKRAMWIAAVIAFVVGLAVAWLLARMLRKKPS